MGREILAAQIEVFLGWRGEFVGGGMPVHMEDLKKTNIFAHSPVITSVPADEYQDSTWTAAMKDFLQTKRYRI